MHPHVLDVAVDSELGGEVHGMKIQGGEVGAVGGKTVDDVEAGVDGLSGFQDQTVVLLKQLGVAEGSRVVELVGMADA